MEKIDHQLDIPSTFQSANYHGIEYHRTKTTSLYMITCGIQRCLPGYYYPHNAREGYHLHAVLSGKGVLQVNGQEYHIHEGQFFLLKDREDIFYQADQEDPWYYVWITLGGFSAGTCMEYAGFTDGVYVQDCRVDMTELFSIVKDILERPHLTRSSEIYRMSLGLRFLSLVIESKEKGEKSAANLDGLTADDYVDYAVRYIRGNYASIHISDVVEYIGISRTYFSEIFRKRMFMSPQEYLMQVRMSKGKELLLQTTAPINVIAREVGYEDQLTFSKIFKKKFGLSPEQYRKKQDETHSV